MTDSDEYTLRVTLLSDLEALSTAIARTVIDPPDKSNYLRNYLAHCFNTINPAGRMLLWGLSEGQTLDTANALRTLLENWANLNHVLSDDAKRDDRAKKIEESALAYTAAFQGLQQDSSQGLQALFAVERWTESGPAQRVKNLGEGPEFQYEFLSRYTHADVWTVINDYLTVNKEQNRIIMLTWGIEFVNHTIWAAYNKNLLVGKFKDQIEALNIRVANVVGG